MGTVVRECKARTAAQRAAHWHVKTVQILLVDFGIKANEILTLGLVLLQN